MLNGVRVLTVDIAELGKTRTDSHCVRLFGPAIFGALRRTHTVANRIEVMVMAPHRDGNPPREEYLDFFHGLDKVNETSSPRQ